MNYDALNACKLFLLDMDGTLYLGDEVFNGAIDFIGTIDRDRPRLYLSHQQLLPSR